MAPQASLVTKLRVQLKLAIARLRMVQQRDEQLGKAQRRAMAQLLEAGKVDSATIRVENIIRSDITTELHKLLELYCELLLARSGLLESSTCDPGLEEAVASIVYAAPKTEIKELGTVRLLLGEKFGKEFVMQAMDNATGKVNEKVMRKLSVEPPRKELVQGYLEEIAKAYGVDWPRSDDANLAPVALLEPEAVDDDEGGGSGDDKLLGAQTHHISDQPLATVQGKLFERGTADPRRALDTSSRSPLTVTPPHMTTDNVRPRVKLGSLELKPLQKKKNERVTAAEREPEGAVPDMNDLERRFSALKKR